MPLSPKIDLHIPQFMLEPTATPTPTPTTTPQPTPVPSTVYYVQPPTVSVRPAETYQYPTVQRAAIDQSLLILGGIALLALIVLMKK